MFFSKDPLFWELLNSEREEVRFEKANNMNVWRDKEMQIRRRFLIHFGYGYLVEERNRREL